MDNLAVTQSFKIGGDRAINILSSGDLFRGLGALDFIKISQDALPKGTNIKKLRIDAAGYQASIIDYCFEHDIELYAIYWNSE
jgi:hypothetical protein